MVWALICVISVYLTSSPVLYALTKLLFVPREVSWLQSLSYCAPFIWNNLPDGIKESDSVWTFKSKLKLVFLPRAAQHASTFLFFNCVLQRKYISPSLSLRFVNCDFHLYKLMIYWLLLIINHFAKTVSFDVKE